jgi:putative ATP-dependent endonuclease of the OLD family
MKLKSVTITNFRCYKTPLFLSFEDLTTLIGRNDAGKSSLLDALDVFFNDRLFRRCLVTRSSLYELPACQS